MTTTAYPALRVTMDRYTNIDPNNDLTLTDDDQFDMRLEALMTFIRHADEFLAQKDLELLPNGVVVGPTGISLDSTFEEEYREHLADWDASALIRKWIDGPPTGDWPALEA